jgi:hypothetical protein
MGVMRQVPVLPGLVLALLLSCGGGSTSPRDGGAAGAAGGAAGTGGASGAGGGRPCLDTACAGQCVGDSCGGAWTCDTQVACSQVATGYCGCDGKSFIGSSCAQRAYYFVGTCEGGVSCDTSKVLCKRAEPLCPAGQVVSVVGTCYGPCVPVAYCSCAPGIQCPAPSTCVVAPNDHASSRCAFSTK